MSLKVIDADGTLSPAPRNLPNELFITFERSDDSAIMDELQGAVVDEYVYSFRQGSSIVTGLSLPGVMAVAQRLGGITCGQPIWTITDDEITCDISATDHKVGLTVWGTATAPYDEYNKGTRDKFARAKALSKAQRNAIRKVIPETIATQMLKTFLSEKQRGNQPAQRPQQRPTQPARRPLPPGTPIASSETAQFYEDMDNNEAESIRDATVIDGNVVTDDGEIVGELQHSQYRLETLMAEFQRQLRGAKTQSDLVAVSTWGVTRGLGDISELQDAYKERKRELRDEAKQRAAQPELVGVE